MGAGGHLLIGDKGQILSMRTQRQRGYSLIPESRAREYVGHYQEWIDACKGGKPPGANFDWAGPLTEVVLLGNVCLRQQLREELTFKKLHWDGEAMRFTNSDEANKFLKREYRQGWT